MLENLLISAFVSIYATINTGWILTAKTQNTHYTVKVKLSTWCRNTWLGTDGLRQEIGPLVIRGRTNQRTSMILSRIQFEIIVFWSLMIDGVHPCLSSGGRTCCRWTLSLTACVLEQHKDPHKVLNKEKYSTYLDSKDPESIGWSFAHRFSYHHKPSRGPSCVLISITISPTTRICYNRCDIEW